VTTDGQVFEEGDAKIEFAIESISKVFTMALAMEEVGPKIFRHKVGADPTGMPFNSVMALEMHSGRPLSALVNAGAICSTSLVAAANAEERWSKVLDMQSEFAGRKLAMSDAVNNSEQATNFHNRAIAWLLRCSGFIYSDPMEACDVYTRQCSTLITSVDLAAMGATLANKGVNPLTSRRVIASENVPHILAEMTMEGLYESSGDWAYTVGLPGKSGVGGGLLAVAPGKLAIAAFSPPLDGAGNSVRGQLAIAQVTKELGLGLYQA
jgi:glutaminase